MHGKLKRSIGCLTAISIVVGLYNNVFAAISEYTPGVREKHISLQEYESSADDYNVNAYDTYRFVDCNDRSQNFRMEDKGTCLGNTSCGAYIRFNRMDFRDKELSKLKLTFARDSGYGGEMRVYSVPCDYELGEIPGGIIDDGGAVQILNYSIDKSYTTGGWYEKKQIDIDTITDLNGVYDIIFTFGSHGLGCFYEFSFDGNERHLKANDENIADCERKIKFSSAYEYDYAGFEQGSRYVGNTGGGKWLLYRNIDFGDSGIEYFNYKASKDGEHMGRMNVYLIEPGTDVRNGVPDDAKQILSEPRNSNDNTDSWDIPREFQASVKDGEFVTGIKDVLISFNYIGLGNFYDFSFTKCKPIILSNAGEVTYREYIPFNTEETEITYISEYESALSITVGNETKKVKLSAGKNTVAIPFDNKVFKGENIISVNSYGLTEIRQIILRKEKCRTATPTLYEYYDEYPMINYSEIEETLKTAIIFNLNSPIYMMGNAKSYINYNDASETPCLINNTAYVPLESFALSTGAYFEENDNFFLLRFDNVEVVLKDNKEYIQKNYGKYIEIAKDAVKQNGRFYVPLKKYLELSGRYVIEKDGFIIADNELKVKNILIDRNYSQLSSIYEELIYEPINGNIYYVSQDERASDTNDGSANAPFRTISKAAETAQAGDTVIIDSGTYREEVIPKSNGTNGNPITFRAAKGAEVTISALEQAPEDYAEENRLRVYSIENMLPQGRNMVFLNGEAIAEGRYPNEDSGKTYDSVKKKLDLSPLWPTSGNITINEGNAFCENAKELSDGFFAGATLVSHNSSGYVISTAKVTDSANGNIYLGDKTVNWWWDNQLNENDYAYITGFKNSVDMPGEWYADPENEKLYIIPIDESDTYEIKIRQLCIDLTGRQNIQFIGINTIGGGINMCDSKMCVLNDGKFRYMSHYTYSEDQHYGFIDGGSGLEPNGAPRRGEMGIYISGDSNAIINSDIEYSAAAAVYDTGKYSLIYNNKISETGYMGAYVGGIFIMPDATRGTINDVRGGHRIYYNTIDKTGRAGIEVSAKEEEWFYKGLTPYAACDIAYNFISNGSIISRDTGNIYIHGVVMGEDDNKTKIRNNIVSNQRCTDSHLCFGIYFDNWTQMIENYENVLLYTDYSPYIRKTADILYQSEKNFATAFSYINAWNNKQLTNKRTLPLMDDDYPNGKRFRAGAESWCENEEADFTKYTPIETNTAEINMDQTVNALKIYYIADPCKPKEKMKIIINDGVYEIEPDSIGEKNGYVNSITLPLKDKGDVKIYTEDSRICGLKTINTDNILMYGKKYGGEFSGGDTDKAHTKKGPDGEHELLYETWSNFRLKYSDIYMGGNVDTSVISYSSFGDNSGGTIQITIGDNLAKTDEIVVEKDDWGDYSPTYAKLSDSVPAGKYDVYVDFRMKSPQTCNFWWLGFTDIDEIKKNIYTNVDLSDEDIIKNAEFTDDGIVVSNETEISIKCADFGQGDVFRMIADYDFINDANLELAVYVDNKEKNMLLNPEFADGTHFGIPVSLQSADTISGIHDVKIKFDGSGQAILRSLAFEKMKMYFTEFSIGNGIISGKLQNTGQKFVAAVYTPDGKLKDIRICEEINDNVQFTINNDVNDYIFKLFGFETLENMIPVDTPIIYAKQKEK